MAIVSQTRTVSEPPRDPKNGPKYPVGYPRVRKFLAVYTVKSVGSTAKQNDKNSVHRGREREGDLLGSPVLNHRRSGIYHSPLLLLRSLFLCESLSPTAEFLQQ